MKPLGLRGLPEWASTLDLEPLRWLAKREGMPILSIDTEATTFVDAPQFAIIEVGLVVVKPTGEIAGSDSLLATDYAIHAQASAKSGLTARDLEGAPRFADVADALRLYLSRSIVTGYCAHSFDLRGIALEVARCGLEPIVPARVADVKPAYKYYERTFVDAPPEDHKLETLARFFGIDLAGTAHRALYDALLALAVAAQLVARIGSDGFLRPPKAPTRADDGREDAGAPKRTQVELTAAREALRTSFEVAVAAYADRMKLRTIMARDLEDVTIEMGLVTTFHGRDVQGLDGITIAGSQGLRARIAGDRYTALLKGPQP